ncbi:MAG TPA: hypothetical protein PKC39_02020 [Ferruginibacter sp.]|nr:hypothetical protein [Ferruginibacter sp.]HMP19713.1 hypothetical protein [Ferruginibacter sp.]
MKRIHQLLSGTAVALFLIACNADETNPAANTTALSTEQQALVKATDSIFEAKKDSLKKHYETLMQDAGATQAVKDSLKAEKKKQQLALKLQENELLSQALNAEQLIALQQQKEKKKESPEEKISRKLAKLKEEYNITAAQQALILPMVAKAEQAKQALKQQYPGEGKDKTDEAKKAEKKAKQAIDETLNMGLQKIFTAEQNLLLQQKIAEKKMKEIEKKEMKEKD